MLYKAKQGPFENLCFKIYVFTIYLAFTIHWHYAKSREYIHEQKQQSSLPTVAIKQQTG